MDTAVGGEEIWVANGIYTDVHNHMGLHQIVYLDKVLTIQGGYAVPFEEPPDPVAHPTLLDARHEGRVAYITGATVKLIGLQLTGGNATGPEVTASNNKGGGVYGVNASVTMSQNIVFSNTAGTDVWGGMGGGLAFEQSVVTLTNSTIEDNLASQQEIGSGGGLFMTDSRLLLVDSQILRNTALITASTDHCWGEGGGIALYNSSGQLNHNVIDGNVALEHGGIGWGGGIAVSHDHNHDNLLLHDNQIRNNIALVQSYSGIECVSAGHAGGIAFATHGMNNTLAVTMTQNLIWHNTAAITANIGIAGGVLAVVNDVFLPSTITLTFENNQVQENLALAHGLDQYLSMGGGLAIHNVAAYLEGNNFISNKAADASAVYFGEGQIIEQNDIVRQNISDDYLSANSMVFHKATADLINVVVTDNQAKTAALKLWSSHVNLLHPTIARNFSDSAIYLADIDLYSDGVPSNLTITNAIIVSHPVGITVTDYNTVTVDGVLWHGKPLTISYGPLAQVTIYHEVIGDPLFASDGYHILPGSAAIGQGIPVGNIPDIDGEPRLPLPALGADEYWLGHWYLPMVKRTL